MHLGKNLKQDEFYSLSCGLASFSLKLYKKLNINAQIKKSIYTTVQKYDFLMYYFNKYF